MLSTLRDALGSCPSWAGTKSPFIVMLFSWLTTWPSLLQAPSGTLLISNPSQTTNCVFMGRNPWRWLPRASTKPSKLTPPSTMPWWSWRGASKENNSSSSASSALSKSWLPSIGKTKEPTARPCSPKGKGQMWQLPCIWEPQKELTSAKPSSTSSPRGPRRWDLPSNTGT